MKFLLPLALIATTALGSETNNPDIPAAELLTTKYLDAISQREVGQKRFATKVVSYGMARSARAGGAAPEAMNAPGGDREIQESDVYKLGKESQKELFLLNSYRGFQVVSFADGVESPKIKGRLPIYNKWSSEMYYLESQDQVLVLNTEWGYSQNRWSSNHKTKLYLIDVKDSSQPKLVKSLEVPGYLQNSRMVGDVLYTVTNNNNHSERRAQITSVKLSDGELKQIDNVQLDGENKYLRTLNVVQKGEKYYAISTLTSWRDRKDLINVHDISSAEGKISKLFTAQARGQIRERSQTFVHKGYLFAVSNYQKDRNSKMRVSVEAFEMTAAGKDEVVVSEEKRRISVGDTNGQHANLQDVRVSDDMLYAFWVPANNIDPFDLFDISNPAEGIKHLGQLQFDGWISKAFPIEYKGKKFVLGLGWIVPATSEENKRYPQAKLFEVKEENGVFKHETVASLTLDSDEVWASLNARDKFFEIMAKGEGQYDILFPVTFRKQWKSGAKIVSVNLNDQKISEGASIVAEQSWLKRVFSNPEIQAINTFSNQELATFSKEKLDGSDVAEAVSILELARNIVDFKVLDNEIGAQIVSGKNSVEVRKVSLSKTDSEKIDVLDTTKVTGSYRWHKVQSGKLYVVTQMSKDVQTKWGYTRSAFDHANLNIIDLTTLKSESKLIQLDEKKDGERYYFDLRNVVTGEKELFTIEGKLFEMNDSGLSQVEVEKSCQYFADFSSYSLSLHKLGTDIYGYRTFKVDANDKKTTREGRFVRGHSYNLPFMKKFEIANGKLTCGESINVPGRPATKTNGFLVAVDREQRGYRPFIGIDYLYAGARRPYYGSVNSKTIALKELEGEVEITDVLGKDITGRTIGSDFLTYQSSEARLDLWSLNNDGLFMSRPQFLGYNSSETTYLVTLKEFQGRNFVFMKKNKKVDVYEVMKNKRLKKLNIVSSYDTNTEDGSGEYVFAMNNIEASADLSKFIIAQGFYGVTELSIK